MKKNVVWLVFLAIPLCSITMTHAAETRDDQTKAPASPAAKTETQADSNPTGTPSALNVPSPNACQSIACSGRGICIISNQGPMCQCNAGFSPDEKTGLNCIAASPPPLPTSNTASVPSPPLQGGSIANSAQALLLQRNQDIAPFANALPFFPFEKLHVRYTALLNRGRATNFPSYVGNVFYKQRKKGIVYLILSGGLFALSGVMGGLAGYAHNEGLDDNEIVFGALAFAGGITSLVFLIVGASKTAKWNQRIRMVSPLIPQPN